MSTIELPENPAMKRPLPRIDDIHSEEAVRLYKAREPFVARDSKIDLARYTVEGFKKYVGDQMMEFTVEDPEGSGERKPVVFNVHEMFGLSMDPDWQSKYRAATPGPTFELLDPGRGRDKRWEALSRNFVVPPFIDPEYMWLTAFIKNSAAHNATPEAPIPLTPCHCDDMPLDFVFWQIQGSKHITLFPPEMAPFLAVRQEGHLFPFASIWADATELPTKHPELKKAWCYVAELQPGDVAFWPGFWYHWIVHAREYQVNVRALFCPEFYKLDATSAAWSFCQAMAKNLGGFEHAEENFKQLPPETQELLKNIEKSLLDTPDLLDPRNNFVQKYQHLVEPGHDLKWARSKDRYVPDER